ncbi:hypothetical protein SNE40_009266 [Patella caerulea]|uniref:Uncharacterized protein n=1 Tax=Patella caerulea TaxID=87958 RepID=A0AAN8JQR7_PATCE
MELLQNDQKKHRVRALQVERRRFELELANFDAAKRFISVDMRKAQTEMKRRLKRYKDRQKEIVASRIPSEREIYGQFITRPTTASSFRSRLTSRPCTSSYIHRMAKYLDTDDDEEREIDPAFLTDRTRSKIDLRPSSAWSFKNRAEVNTGSLDYRRTGCSLKTLRLGTPASQIRYFDEDELRERNLIYSQILDQHKRKEREHFEEIALKVSDFCDNKK